MIVNVIESFVQGLFIALSQQSNLDEKYFLFAAIGFCGSLTTMFFLTLDSSNLLENNQYVSLIVNILANVGLSITAF